MMKKRYLTFTLYGTKVNVVFSELAGQVLIFNNVDIAQQEHTSVNTLHHSQFFHVSFHHISNGVLACNVCVCIHDVRLKLKFKICGS